MTATFGLPSADRQIVLDILRAIASPGATVWAFGSRATGRARRYSDLDLAIDAGRRLTLSDFARLDKAFEDSDLPYKVDIVDWQALDEAFRRRIAGQRVLLTGNPETAPDPGESSA